MRNPRAHLKKMHPVEDNIATNVFSNTWNCKREDARKGVWSSFSSSSRTVRKQWISENRPPHSHFSPNTPAYALAPHTPVPTPGPLPRSTRPEPETRYCCHPAARRNNRPLSGPRNRLRLPYLPADASLPPTRINDYKILKRIHHMKHAGNKFPYVIQSLRIRIAYVASVLIISKKR